jgi:hypothetical protein
MMGEVPSYGQGPELGAPLMMEKQPTPATSPPTDDPEPEKDQGQEHFMPVFEQTDDAKLKQVSIERTDATVACTRHAGYRCSVRSRRRGRRSTTPPKSPPTSRCRTSTRRSARRSGDASRARPIRVWRPTRDT